MHVVNYPLQDKSLTENQTGRYGQWLWLRELMGCSMIGVLTDRGALSSTDVDPEAEAIRSPGMTIGSGEIVRLLRTAGASGRPQFFQSKPWIWPQSTQSKNTSWLRCAWSRFNNVFFFSTFYTASGQLLAHFHAQTPRNLLGDGGHPLWTFHCSSIYSYLSFLMEATFDIFPSLVNNSNKINPESRIISAHHRP